MAGCAVWFYLWKLIWPAKLIFVYPPWSIDERNVLSYLPGVLLVVILALAWRQRHSWGRPVVMLIVCYVGLLLPVLGFVNINFMAYSLVADHWQYAAMIVPCAVFAGVAATLARRRFFPPPAAFVLCLALLATLGTLTWRQSRMYADIDALYQTTIDRNPSCWMVYNNLGLLVMHRGRTDEAMSYYQKALQIKPDHVYALNNLGNVLASRGQWDEAIAYYRKALSIEPNYAMGHNNLGNILVHLGQLDEGRAQYQRALEIDPTCWNAHCNMGDLAAGLGCFEEALAHYRRAAEILPNDASTLGNLGAALAATGQFDEAVAQCRKALEIKPDDVEIRYQLGVALAGQGRFPEALTQYREALKINPKHARVHSSLAWLRATCPQAAFRNGVEAVEHAQRASQLCGGMRPEVLNALAAAYAEAGWFPEALATARKALELARQQNNHALAEALQERIARYETGKPYRQPLSSPASRSRKP